MAAAIAAVLALLANWVNAAGLDAALAAVNRVLG